MSKQTILSFLFFTIGIFALVVGPIIIEYFKLHSIYILVVFVLILLLTFYLGVLVGETN